MADLNLTDKVNNINDKEIFFGREIYKNCEIRESYNKKFYFIRLFDTNSGRLVKEVSVPIAEIHKESKDEYDAARKISDFIFSTKPKNFDIINLYSLANIYHEKLKEKK